MPWCSADAQMDLRFDRAPFPWCGGEYRRLGGVSISLALLVRRSHPCRAPLPLPRHRPLRPNPISEAAPFADPRKSSMSPVDAIVVVKSSPVVVRTTPLIADASARVLCGSLASCARGAKIFLTSSSGVLSFFCPMHRC